MNSPVDKHTRQTDRPACLDISPERLNSMSPSQLAESMEQALEHMTEETYDPAVIDAYLDALDRAAPMPECQGAETALADLEKRVGALSAPDRPSSQPARRAARGRRGLHAGLAAVLMTACLLGGMVATQAAGLDVFGALARWTEDVFSFGSIRTAQNSNTLSDQSAGPRQLDVSQQDADIPEEYQELYAELEKRNLPFYCPNIPEGFEVDDLLLYVYPDPGNIEFSILYIRDNDYIGFELVQNVNTPISMYEKDTQNVEIYMDDGVTHYIFDNKSNTLAVWTSGNIEYSLATNLSVDELKEII